MTTSYYLEHYLDSVESLPGELRRNLTLLLEMDEKNSNTLLNLDTSSVEYMQKVNNLQKDEKAVEKEKMREKLKSAGKIADEKISISFQTYELVDKHIVKLDSTLANLETEIKERVEAIFEMEKKNNQNDCDEVDENSNNNEKIKQDKSGQSPTFNTKLKSKKVKHRKVKNKNGQNRVNFQENSSKDQSNLTEIPEEYKLDVMDMPIDPNEPTYCFCKQVSFGEMIGCDNPNCIIEWFHFACVELTKKPKGDWYCKNCKISQTNDKLNMTDDTSLF